MENRGATANGADSRLAWVDVARGIGMIAVVVGHVWTRGRMHDALYSFHMPLFFLLSGLLSQPRPVGAFTRRMILSQMRPYALFLALLIVADQIIEPLKGSQPIFHHWPQDVVPILLGGTWLRGPYTIFWFVPCLMMARILFNMALARWPDPRDGRWAMLLLPMLALAYGLGAVTSLSPMGLLSVPMAVLLLWVGAAWRTMSWRAWMAAPLALAAFAGLSLWVPTLNMKAGDYGWPLLSIGAAIATGLLIATLSRVIAPWAGMLAAVGRASLVIMYLHVAVIHYGTPYLGRGWLFVLALLLPWSVHALIARSRRASRLLL